MCGYARDNLAQEWEVHEMYMQAVQGLRVEGKVAPLSRPNMTLVRLACTSPAVVRGNTYRVARPKRAGPGRDARPSRHERHERRYEFLRMGRAGPAW